MPKLQEIYGQSSKKKEEKPKAPPKIPLEMYKAEEHEKQQRLERLKLAKQIDVRNEGILSPQRRAIRRLQEHEEREERKRQQELLEQKRARRLKRGETVESPGAESYYDEEDEYDEEISPF